MKFWIALVLLGYVAMASATDDQELMEDEARFLYFNTSSTATSLTLLGALILLGVIAYLVYAGGLLGSSSGYNRNDYAQYDPNYAYNQEYSQYRSNDGGYDMASSLNIIQWISMLQDLYEKFDYNDIECQKRLICEVMREPDYYGAAAQKFKAGFKYAQYLEVLNLPDDMRELLDEYLDANSRSEAQKDCGEFYSCPYSIKESFTNNSVA